MPTVTKLSLSKDKINILLLEGVHDNAIDELARGGYASVERLPRALDEEELLERIGSVHILGIRSRTHLTARVLEAASKLMAVGCFCIGTNQVDLKAARRLGIPVFNAPYSNTRSVAELVIGEIIMLMRGIFEKSALVHGGGWMKSAKDFLRDSRQDAGHHRLWPHRHPGVDPGRSHGHAGPLLRRGPQAGSGQRAPL